MKTTEIRSAFLNYFASKQHQIVASSSLVPGNDPTLLFTNAGMVQFKDVFLGDDKRPYSRATTSQRCVRAGGKHNDLENVGYTARHHTFFEMLGNFSFGDYFKRDAIQFAWEFLTSSEWLNISTEKLWVTVYQEDDEAFDVWSQVIGVPVDRIIRIGDKGGRYNSDNFWAMGDTGPCGPCTEIFYDHGEEIWGGPPGSPEEDGDRYIEIWNVVFMQFNRSADGTMAPLPKPSVDTGMGLERIAAVMQSVHSNYEIDLFQNLLKEAARETATDDLENKSLRVIADHIRSCSFLVVDGVIPSNEGRGYVLRRIIRRAIRHGNQLGQKQPFFHKLVAALVAEMGEAYPELKEQQALVERVLLQEEEQFAKTLDKGMKVLEEAIAGMEGSEIPGSIIFTLYDTYGFPVDLTNDIARERELSLDMAGYETAMEQQRERARAASKFGVDYNAGLAIEGVTEFTGYQTLEDQSTVRALFVNNEPCAAVAAGQPVAVVLDHTPFYGESGGQVGDQGELVWQGGRMIVRDTQKEGDNHVHLGELVEGELKAGDTLTARVEADKRAATRCNHSATHLLHAALRQVLGEHVSQKGSLVDDEKLRFDFSHFEAVKPEQLREIERIVNAQIRANTPVQTEVTDMDHAQELGAMALFGEKYGDSVRVLTMGEDRFSVELCGGTHVERTGDIGSLVITTEAGIAAGVRRIEAVTAEAARRWSESSETLIAQLCSQLKGGREALPEKVQQLQDRSRQLERELETLKQKLASAKGSDLAAEAIEVAAGIKLLAAKLDGVDPKSLRDMVDQLKNKLGNGVVLLATVADDKVSLAAGVSKELTGQIKAGDLLKMVATQVGGKGGGRPDFAQGGGTDVAALPAAVASVEGWVKEQLG
ncbi:alanine--tRNA ligase [Aestuariirhabdus litorea]|uniref:Alanine--tRNA ligase n=1 Tax=Aestuariirhabdus litorea TaxID=2528527 RepID=A0A3P3VWI2_9GAMM|nr:alanine--tRNA ligase [Aestuariirhabdus litorea]RRJ85073.1 alanine--tRNA ligase [Aestuariirhabdus litorea]RWW98298.1 alanine--tRNA ligase [Endozoicomonadaceae bacterium GTF-13]